MEEVKLPEVTAYHCGDWRLPERTVPLYVDALYTADQMREAILAEREQADQDAKRYRALFTITDFCRDPLWTVVSWMRDDNDVPKAEVDEALDAAIREG